MCLDFAILVVTSYHSHSVINPAYFYQLKPNHITNLMPNPNIKLRPKIVFLFLDIFTI